MNVHDFNSLLGTVLELKLRSNNKRSMFNVLDTHKDGYCRESDFMKLFTLSSSELSGALEDRSAPQHQFVLDLVVEQIYHEIVYFKQNGLVELQAKLDKKGQISPAKLEKQLSFFKVNLTAEERQVLSSAGEVDEFTGEKLIPFRRMVETTITKANIKIDFRLSFAKQGTLYANSGSKERRFKEMEQEYEERLKKKEEEERRKKQALEDAENFSQFESSEDMDAYRQEIINSNVAKEAKNIKSKFGKKFLEIFQRSLIDTITK
mmetsp:Transcript_1871/g.2322  ORF Transcript_1871/g.2322 Transcript_1871/m.2322 type:complete len:263 (-) Transcript_1871:1363-2151(-)